MAAVLFPELLRGCEWWGYIDNDIWLGDLRTHVIPQLLTGGADFYGKDVKLKRLHGPAYGPFTLQRNSRAMAALLRSSSARRSLQRVLNVSRTASFDEWGEPSWGGFGYEYSYSGLVMAAVEAGQLKLGHIPQAFLWDQPCQEQPLDEEGVNCSVDPLRGRPGGYKLCVLTMEGSGSAARSSLAMRNCDGVWQSCFYCHFQFGKSRPSVRNMSRWDQGLLLHQRTLARSLRCGIFVPGTKELHKVLL